MKGFFESFPMALKAIFKDPINILLSIIPTIIALAIYFYTIVEVYRNSDRFIAWLRPYVYSPEQASFAAKVLTAIAMIFIFFLMSWTFIIIVGIISAPFNSMLSSRIEKKLVQNVVDPDTNQTLEKIGKGIGQTFKNEFKKLIFILIVAGVAFLLNLFPLFYPIGVFLVATLLAVQFVDYSWSRHDLHFGSCLKDTLANIIPYSLGGFVFLLFVAIPILNAFVPAFATSYFTVLWLHRQKKIG